MRSRVLDAIGNSETTATTRACVFVVLLRLEMKHLLVVSLLPCVLLVQAARTRREDKYTTQYDNVDIDAILNNERILKNYVNCLLYTGPCTPDGKLVRAGCLLARRHGEPGSIPGWVTTRFSHAGIAQDDAAGRRVFSGISRFPLHFIPAQLHTHLNHPHWLSTSLLKAAQISSLGKRVFSVTSLACRRCSTLISLHPHRLSKPGGTILSTRLHEKMLNDMYFINKDSVIFTCHCNSADRTCAAGFRVNIKYPVLQQLHSVCPTGIGEGVLTAAMDQVPIIPDTGSVDSPEYCAVKSHQVLNTVLSNHITVLNTVLPNRITVLNTVLSNHITVLNTVLSNHITVLNTVLSNHIIVLNTVLPNRMRVFFFSENILEALETGCTKCSKTQMEKVEQFVKFLKDNKPEYYKSILERYDPDGEYVKKFGDALHMD
ncbi:hypothetical protein PR048_025735 [Dryococelus australis]|uniref:Uncharacterized protein n=1 Tax=Dryococelus australis TaxID=614101 RepID=A0ABQ9GJC7_9NEOP|nr:hypothetical protein PR048_025735 [Dryococelus australis]